MTANHSEESSALPPLPLELQALEQQLATRAGSAPGAALKVRLLAAVNRELASQIRRPQPNRIWWYSTAAAVLVMANLSMMATAVTHFVPGPQLSNFQVLANAQSLEQLDMDLSAAEARRLAILGTAIEDLPCVPTLPPTHPFHARR